MKIDVEDPVRRSPIGVYDRDQRFPPDFIWGAATSSYQVEGAWNVDGKGESIWDNVAHNHPERIANGSNGDDAAKSYLYYKDDVQALKQAGFRYYRFSISWPRVLPSGDTSNINEKGIQYYKNIINELLANNIKPIVTIFHWEMPQKLQDEGGILNPKIVDLYIDYATLLFKRFGDRVFLWNTFNEPNIFCEFGHGTVMHALFVDQPGVGPYLCGYHILLANARVFRLYHKEFGPERTGKIGIVLHSNNYWPKDRGNEEDKEAARRMFDFWLGWFAHPIFSPTGDYPKVIYIRETYQNPAVLITENGWSDHGEIDDIARDYYYRGHFQAILDAIDDDCRVYGHVSWSLLDCSEWTSGYNERFGLFQVIITVKKERGLLSIP